MSLTNISHLTFGCDGSYEDVFTDVSFQIDTAFCIVNEILNYEKVISKAHFGNHAKFIFETSVNFGIIAKFLLKRDYEVYVKNTCVICENVV